MNTFVQNNENNETVETSQQPHIYILYTGLHNQTKKHFLGYKTSYKAALRAARRIQMQLLQQLPLGTHKYWWKSAVPAECDWDQRKFVLYSQPYNNLMQYSAVEYVLYVERVDELDLESLQLALGSKTFTNTFSYFTFTNSSDEAEIEE